VERGVAGIHSALVGGWAHIPQGRGGAPGQVDVFKFLSQVSYSLQPEIVVQVSWQSREKKVNGIDQLGRVGRP